MELQAIIDALRKDYIDPLANQFPLPFEPNQIDLANRKINWRPGQKEKLANDSVSFAAGNSPAMALTFIGKGAKTWDEKAAKKAAALLSRGVDPEKVWQRHMTGQMPDGALFQEIDDSTASFAKNTVKQLQKYGARKQSAVFNHPDLYQAYPDIADSALGIGRGGNYSGEYNPSNDFISLNIPVKNTNLETTKDLNLHEIQHAIQQREGWARGGSPEQFKIKEINKTKEQATKIADHASNIFNSLPDELKPYARIINQGRDDGSAYAKIAKYPKAKSDWADYVMAQRQVKELLESPQEIQILTPSEQYRRLTGEAQARATQERMGMDMAERRANYPLKNNKLADVLLDDLIWKYE